MCRDKSININEFTAICTALFRNEYGKPYKMDSQLVSDLFMIFNVSGDGSMSKQEFVYCWNGWIKKVSNCSLLYCNHHSWDAGLQINPNYVKAEIYPLESICNEIRI